MVAHAPKAAANSADDEIVRLVRDDARPQEIRVVTSDNSLINPVNAAGASVYPAESFRNLIDPRSIGCDGYEELAPVLLRTDCGPPVDATGRCRTS